jgi:hypothetical protein
VKAASRRLTGLQARLVDPAKECVRKYEGLVEQLAYLLTRHRFLLSPG